MVVWQTVYGGIVDERSKTLGLSSVARRQEGKTAAVRRKDTDLSFCSEDDAISTDLAQLMQQYHHLQVFLTGDSTRRHAMLRCSLWCKNSIQS